MHKKIAFIIFIIIVSGLSGILADRYFFPYLAGHKWFQRHAFLKRSLENTTVINKTEQIIVKEEATVNKTAANNASSVVTIISYPEDGGVNLSNKVLGEAKSGTGTIITSDGFVMTYAFAVNPSKSKYKILTADGGEYDGELAGIDSYSGLAFFKIVASNLPTVSFANSDDSSPGEKIIAVGRNSANAQNIFSSGLLSSYSTTFNLSGKTLSSSEKMEGVFETDLSDATDFVGGLALDYSGQTVGIIGMITIDGKDRPFIIPANKVKNVIDRAIKRELDRDPVLGIYYLPIDKKVALSKNLPRSGGALVYSPSGQQGLAVIADSPAEKAGIRLNDIIIAIGDEVIDQKNTLPDILYQYAKGEKIELKVLRGDQEILIVVQI